MLMFWLYLGLEEQLQTVHLSLDREMMHRYESCLLCVCCRYIICTCVGTSFFVFFFIGPFSFERHGMVDQKNSVMLKSDAYASGAQL